MSRKSRSRKRLNDTFSTDSSGGPQELRIIGGRFRGRKLRYHGDPVVRPMKHRVREAIFNLISTGSKGRHAIDLFAGTGALGLEALSRGATGATFIERHVPSARIIEDNIARLDVQDQCTVLVTSAFLWGKRNLLRSANPTHSPQPAVPWLVFCSPPYAFYVDKKQEMLELIGRVTENAPPDSVVVVESDEHFDFGELPEEWDVRAYPPAFVGIWRK